MIILTIRPLPQGIPPEFSTLLSDRFSTDEMFVID